jgi:prepilin-type N-terminal cleavage/methylation domain-containing protein
MELRNISMGSTMNNSIRAFTLLEVLIVLALVAVVIGATVFSLSTYATYYRATENARLVTALQMARTRAIHGDYSLPSGVAIYPSGYEGYVIFSGFSYQTRLQINDENILATYPLMPTMWSPATIVFTPLSGTTTPATIVLTDLQTGLVSTTTITYDGYIE